VALNFLVGRRQKNLLKVEGEFQPRTVRESLEGVEFVLDSIFDLGARSGLVVKATPPFFTPGESEPVPIVQEAGGAKDRCGRIRKIRAREIHPQTIRLIPIRYPSPLEEFNA
jgi:hypothetical protein